MILAYCGLLVPLDVSYAPLWLRSVISTDEVPRLLVRATTSMMTMSTTTMTPKNPATPPITAGSGNTDSLGLVGLGVVDGCTVVEEL